MLNATLIDHPHRGARARRNRGSSPSSSNRRLWLVLLVALLIPAWRTALVSPVLATRPTIQFVPQARGRTVEATPLRAAAGAGAILAWVPAEAELTIGGRVRFRAGLGPAEALWVQAPTEQGTSRYGFLPVDTVRVTAGQAKALDLSGTPLYALLAPGDGQPAVGRAAGALADGGRLAASPAAVTAPAAAASPSSARSVEPSDLGIAWLPDSVQRWAALIEDAATRHAVDPQLVAIVLLVESGGDAQAMSPAGARGLMQVMPSTAAGIASARGMDWPGPEALLLPETAIDFGTWYLARQLASFGSAQDPDWQRSVELAAAAYNGGPGTVTRHLAGASLPAETTRYRGWVGGMWRERGEASSTTYATWWQAGGRRLVEAAWTR
jgi:soluble lytic murein transglycosylase-like protein